MPSKKLAAIDKTRCVACGVCEMCIRDSHPPLPSSTSVSSVLPQSWQAALHKVPDALAPAPCARRRNPWLRVDVYKRQGAGNGRCHLRRRDDRSRPKRHDPNAPKPVSYTHLDVYKRQGQQHHIRMQRLTTLQQGQHGISVLSESSDGFTQPQGHAVSAHFRIDVYKRQLLF